MANQTHGTQCNITNTTTSRQMWICWRKRKIARDYELQIDAVSHRHHTCRERHSAKLWCFLNKFWRPGYALPLQNCANTRLIGTSNQDQFPFPLHPLRSPLSSIVQMDFWYAQFPSRNILFTKLSGWTRLCNQPIYCLYLLQETAHKTQQIALHAASKCGNVVVGTNLSEIPKNKWRCFVTDLSQPRQLGLLRNRNFH